MKHAQLAERLGVVLLVLIFVAFTWRGALMFYSGDDMMNMYYAWNVNPWLFGKALVMMWIPTYRPLGQAIYRGLFEEFGFHPLPLYVFCWMLLAANVLLAYRFLKAVSSSVLAALAGLSLILIHGQFQDLYVSAGTIYDRLCFFFTALGIAVYAESRRRNARMPARTAVALVAICLLAMDSKESGVALPLLLACYEVLLVRGKSFRAVAAFYIPAAVAALVFVFGRVRHTPELVTTGAYQPHFDAVLWLANVSGYLATLAYRATPLPVVAAAIVLVAMAALAVFMRDRPMLFGLLFFMVTITPVALISHRPGYVLYVPELGLGLYFGGLIARMAPGRELTARGAAIFAAVALVSFKAHAANWSPAMFREEYQPERRLTEHFLRDYPKLAAGSRLLFVRDDFPPRAWDLTFNLRLLYGDKRLTVNRLMALTSELPAPGDQTAYDHIFSFGSNGYSELDNAGVERSVRLNLLRDFPPGRHLDMSRRDRAGYILSGVQDFAGDEKGRWTSGVSVLKFDVYPADTELALRFWVTDFIARPVARTLSLSVNERAVGTYGLDKIGMNDAVFKVPAAAILKDDYTLVTLRVQPPYVDAGGQEMGVLLLSADFRYEKR